MEPQLLSELLKYVASGSGGAGGLFILFLIYKYFDKRRNGNPRRNIDNSGVEIIGVKIESMSSIMELKMDSMIEEQKDTRKLLGKVFEKILEK